MPGVSALSASINAPRSVDGAIAAMPMMRSSGAYVGASSAANNVAWPPWEWP
jgi:hypothetical protein